MHVLCVDTGYNRRAKHGGMEVVAKEFSRYAPAAVHQLAGLAKQAKSEYVQLEASKDLLDRAGFKPVDRSQVQLAGDIKVSIDLG